MYANINADAYLQKIIEIQSFFHGDNCSKPYSIIPWSIPNLCFPLLIHIKGVFMLLIYITNLKIIEYGKTAYVQTFTTNQTWWGIILEMFISLQDHSQV
jgi:hypothetical protein